MYILDLKNMNYNLIKSVRRSDKHKSYNIGAIFKYKRNEKHLTLFELCEGICCVAYQSRIERNVYDVLNDKIIPKLCERLDLNYEEMLIGTSIEELKLGLHEFMRLDIEALKKRYKKCNQNYYFSTNNLIVCMYYLLTKNYSALNDYIVKLDYLKSTMNVLELSCLLLIMIYYYIDTYQYEKAANYIDYANALGSQNNDLNIMLQECKTIVTCSTFSKYKNNNHDIVKNEYEEMKKLFIYAYPFSKQQSLMLYYLETLKAEEAYSILCQYENDSVIVQNDQFNYTKCLVLAKCGKYKECLDLIDSLNEVSHKFVCLYAYSLKEIIQFQSKVVDENMIEDAKSKLKKYIHEVKINNEDTIHIAFIKLMEIEIDGGDNDLVLFNYIKNEMLVLLNSFFVGFYFDYCLEKIYYLIGKLSKYKEAYEILKLLHFSNLK